MDGSGKRFPPPAQQGREESKQAEDFDERGEYDVKVEMSAASRHPDLLPQGLIVGHVLNICAGSPKKRKYCQSKILQPARDHEYERVKQPYRRNDNFGVSIVDRIQDEPCHKKNEQSADESGQKHHETEQHFCPLVSVAQAFSRPRRPWNPCCLRAPAGCAEPAPFLAAPRIDCAIGQLWQCSQGLCERSRTNGCGEWAFFRNRFRIECSPSGRDPHGEAQQSDFVIGKSCQAWPCRVRPA
jgi:hypothetical protein